MQETNQGISQVGHGIAVLGVTEVRATISRTAEMRRRCFASIEGTSRRSCVGACADEQ